MGTEEVREAANDTSVVAARWKMTWSPLTKSVQRTKTMIAQYTVVVRQLADSAGFGGMFRLVALHIREKMPVSRASPASQAPSPARRAALPAIGG